MPGDEEPPNLSLHDAAERLGVHYMTAYRYVRTGRLPATKAGAAWRVRESDVEALRAGNDAEAPPATSAARRRTDRHRRLEARLLAGDEAGSWAILEEAMSAGVAPTSLYLDVMSPAMAAIGEGWAAGRVTVAQEHRASVVMLRIIGRLGPRFVRPGRTRGSIVVGAPPNDHHSVPVALAADLLRNEGFTVVDLGADAPAESFIDAAEEAERLVAVGINATSPDNDAAVAMTVAAVKAALGCPVVLGGHGLPDRAAGLALGADRVTLSADEAIAAFSELADERAPGRRR
ncbi:MAG: B12-binding domain-containing protein [Acidimicrobiales bacterium]|nr:B12-binding domain-containing protein [Acidimicrobiales bacterium]